MGRHKYIECKLPLKCWCVSCLKEYDARKYIENKDYKNELRNKRNKNIRLWYRNLKNNPCTDCNKIFHFSAMHYDHIEDNKIFNVANLIVRGFKRETIQNEIDKCELVCANCHALRTYTRYENLK